MKYVVNSPEYASWLADLANEEVSGEDLRSLLATKIASAEEIERAAREVEIARRVRIMLNNLRQRDVEIPADFEAKLLARVSEDVTLLNLLEVYFTGFSGTLVELINALFSFLPEPSPQEFLAV